MTNMGNQVRQRRLHLSINQTSLAIAAGVSQSAVSRLERGLQPEAATLRVILEALARLELQTN